MNTAETKPLDVEGLFEQAQKLNSEQRLELSERLFLSVQPSSPTAERSEELARRIREHEADPSSSVPLEDALEEARRIADETA